jgi:hypothetical protein
MASYPVYTRQDGRTHQDVQYCWIPDGNDHWAMSLDHRKTGRFVSPTDHGEYTRDANDAMYTQQQLNQHAPQRQQGANTGLTKYFGQVDNFLPLGFTTVIHLLEAEFISALVAQATNQDQQRQGALDTRVHTAREKLVLFWKRYNWDFDRFSQQQNAFYHYSLENNFVGETAHIRGCHAIYNTKESNVRYRCTTQIPGKRFDRFMQDVPTFDNLESDTKTRINETLLAPRTVKDAPGVHQGIYTSFVQHLTQERKQELVDWVGEQFQAHAEGANVVRVGVWVRRVPAQGGHTVDQNMSRARFERILVAAADAGVHEVILLGDGWPSNENWFDHDNSPYSFNPGPNRAYNGFLRLWEDPGIPELDRADPNYHRGYAEQALTYSALYRNPADNVAVNMTCIITNKSGGPDLPSLAGIPQIQIAEMADNEVFIHHRMGFQSLCSPMWTVLRVPQRNVGDQMTLSDPKVQELTTLIRRAGKLRQWHLAALGNDRYTW